MGSSLESCTESVELSEPFELQGRRIHLIDTPGFNESEASGNDVGYHRAQLFRPRTLLAHSSTLEDILTDNPQAIRVCSMLMNIFEDRSRYKVLLGYRNQEAQAILNLLQAVSIAPQFAGYLIPHHTHSCWTTLK